jgi:hypothetical protein
MQDASPENKLRLLMIYACVYPEKFEGDKASKLMQVAAEFSLQKALHESDTNTYNGIISDECNAMSYCMSLFVSLSFDFFSLASSVTLVEMMCMINASGNIFRFIGCRVKVWTNYYKITVQKK